MLGDFPHALNAAGPVFDHVQAVAYRLFAGYVRCCTKDGCEKAGGFGGAFIGLSAPPDAEAGQAGFRVDINEAPVDFAPCRPVAQCADRLCKGRIGQHRSVNKEGRIERAGGKLLR